MNIIVAVDKNWSIGNQGQLLVSIPEDKKLFRDETMGKVIVMGRKTLESLPGKQPLYGRTNIVLTKNPDYKVKGAVVCHSLTEAMEELGKYPEEDCFIIGGQSVYEQFLPYCNTAHVTYIDYRYSADTYFPNLDQDLSWEMVAESDEQTYFDLCYTFRMYQRKA
ncbi:dihydrofolate reductase region [[Clostridium] saccharolyticum WM1]|uniref:Dihydrofolate reductase n=1 Tax=Lacrimispora saccharolytica (strain ATCC 35040 / DSM 2544 / NRCC 2533 / WM1) TaxID=610130 RepID=D9R739_LACSW|nr:dihydrofolate reductase [Lacrimispora saccharolytica]ADL05471.1 dihydrofolate reductase region [[Clostridium] saccharolyticum WM1]QRV20369.1 dihydrofolate reductase [Lacrimispora saccharolytica]